MAAVIQEYSAMAGEQTMTTDANTETGASTTGAAESKAAVPRLTGLDRTKFRCLRNAAYHEDRERHFVRLIRR
jgi:hypothetical protein